MSIFKYCRPAASETLFSFWKTMCSIQCYTLALELKAKKRADKKKYVR